LEGSGVGERTTLGSSCDAELDLNSEMKVSLMVCVLV